MSTLPPPERTDLTVMPGPLHSSPSPGVTEFGIWLALCCSGFGMASGFPLIPAPGVGSALWTAVLFTHFTHVLTVPAGARPAEAHATAASAAVCTVPPLHSTGTAGSSLPFLLPTPSFAHLALTCWY